MLKELVAIPGISVWIISILLSIIGTLISFVIWYILQLIKKAKGLGGEIKENTKQLIEHKKVINEVLSEIHTSNKSVWDELIKLRGSVASGTMVLRRRKTELDKIMADGKGSKDRLAAHDEIIGKSIRLHKRTRQDFDKLRATVRSIGKDLLLIKGKKKDV